MFGVDFLGINTVRRHLAYYGGPEFVTLKHLDVLPACLPQVVGTSAVTSSAVP